MHDHAKRSGSWSHHYHDRDLSLFHTRASSIKLSATYEHFQTIYGSIPYDGLMQHTPYPTQYPLVLKFSLCSEALESSVSGITSAKDEHDVASVRFHGVIHVVNLEPPSGDKEVVLLGGGQHGIRDGSSAGLRLENAFLVAVRMVRLHDCGKH